MTPPPARVSRPASRGRGPDHPRGGLRGSRRDRARDAGDHHPLLVLVRDLRVRRLLVRTVPGRAGRWSRSPGTIRGTCSPCRGGCAACSRTSPATSTRGDVVLLNDPYRGGTHLNDVTLVHPVFDEDGNILVFPAVRAHWVDVGGMVPGSYSGLSTNIYQEGVRIPPIRILERGRSTGPPWPCSWPTCGSRRSARATSTPRSARAGWPSGGSAGSTSATAPIRSTPRSGSTSTARSAGSGSGSRSSRTGAVATRTTSSTTRTAGSTRCSSGSSSPSTAAASWPTSRARTPRRRGW